ncbi:MAG: ComEC/Rec2 family competence protein [Acidobacteriaceae bacterium]
MASGPNPPSVRRFGEMGTAPMLLACCAFSTGILWARFVWAPPLWILVAMLLCATAASILLARRAWHCAILPVAAIFAMLGALSWQGIGATPKAMHLRDFATREEIELSGVVASDGIVAQGMYGGIKETIDLAVESIGEGASREFVSGGARLSLYTSGHRDEDDSEGPPAAVPLILHSGQRIRLRAKLGIPDNYRNPGAFDYRHYLERRGILVSGGGELDSVTIVNEDANPAWERWRANTRQAIVQRIHATFAPNYAVVLDAMLIGDASSIGRDIRNDFQRSGTYHILVVSGFNVGILAFVVFWILRRLRLGDVAATVITLLLTAAYTYLTDAGAPVMRAALMLAIYLVTRALYRDRAALNSVSTAALAILIYDPESLFDPSFQLTFLSVLAIAGIVLPIIESTSGPYQRALQQLPVVGFDRALSPRQAQFRLDLRLVALRIARLTGRRGAYTLVGGAAGFALGFYETLLVSVIMQFALALPMAWYFHRATLTALFANALVVPVTALILPVSIGAICLAGISAKIAFPLKIATEWMLAFITGTVRIFGSMRASDVRIATPGLPAAILALVALTLTITLLHRSSRLLRWAGIASLVVSSLIVFTERKSARIVPSALEVVSIDVGQGDSFLIVSPAGHTLLLDSGGTLNGEHSNFDIGDDVVSPTLWNLGITRLDAVAISHTHADHVGGMSAVIHNFRPRELWLPPGAPVYERDRLLQAAAREDVQVLSRVAGQHFDFGGASVEILSPPAGLDFGKKVKDDDSMALRIGYQGRSALFIGDMGKAGEDRLYSQHPHADLLKVAHHGSANATSEEFLAAVHPSFAMISVGRHNSFRHPRPQTLARLAAAHVRTYRTDLFGATRFDLDARGIRVTSLSLPSPR